MLLAFFVVLFWGLSNTLGFSGGARGKITWLNWAFIIITAAIISIIFIIVIIIAIIITIIIIITNIIIVIIFVIIISTFLLCLYWQQGTIQIK